MRSQLKSYFSITKKEWNGLVVLVILIALVLAAPYGYQLFHKDNTINFKDFEKAAAQLGKPGSQQSPGSNNEATDSKLPQAVLSSFNPNNLSSAQWVQLGLSSHQADIIKHYEAKGGRFYTKEDVQKIYGLTADDYKRLEPYITIPGAEKYKAKIKTGTVIELNSADSAKLTTLPGVGPSFAVRIIRYRNRLGGFYKKEQLKEIYGVDSLLYSDIRNQVTINAKKVVRIDINTISFAQLRIFPYLNYKQVNAIIAYRAQHGNYTSINDMKNIVLLDNLTIQKIEPYLSFK